MADTETQTIDPTHTNGQAPPVPLAPAAAPADAAMTVARVADEPGRAIAAFSDEKNFQAGLRVAKALASSTLVPQAYQGNIPNVLIAMELANRIGCSVLMAMQSLDIVHGRPSWRSSFLIATVNASGRFSPLRFRWQGKEGTDEWGCRAVAKDKDREECLGPLVTIAIAKAEGWFSKNGSKWKTIPELMLMYRAAGWWTRVFCPELSLGMQTSDEAIDTTGYEAAMASAPAPLAPPAQDGKRIKLRGGKGTADPVADADGVLPNDPPSGRQPGED